MLQYERFLATEIDRWQNYFSSLVLMNIIRIHVPSAIIIISHNNLNSMTTLPLINTKDLRSKTRQHVSYLRFPANSQSKTGRYSLQQQTFEAMHNHKYLYIDFQTENKLFQLEKAEGISHDQEEAERIGDSRIGNFEALSKISPSGYRMHKFLSEEKLYFERKKKWKTLLHRIGDDTQMNFNKIRERINPQKLQDFLQNKHNEDKWKKIQVREERLYQQLSKENVKKQEEILTMNQNRVNMHRRLKSHNDFKGKIKLKALNKLNSLLEKS